MAIIDVNWNPGGRELRLFAAVWFPAFGGVVGGIVAWHTGSLPIAAAVWVPTVLLSLAMFAAPRLARPLYVALTCLALPVGWLVSHLFLAMIYYLVFTPVGIALRLFGRDPLQRKFVPSAKTYWVPHPRDDDRARYFQQF
jgi:hypothetical protein